MTQQADIVPGRSCQGCTLCCKLLSIEELEKPTGAVRCTKDLLEEAGGRRLVALVEAGAGKGFRVRLHHPG